MYIYIHKLFIYSYLMRARFEVARAHASHAHGALGTDYVETAKVVIVKGVIVKLRLSRPRESIHNCCSYRFPDPHRFAMTPFTMTTFEASRG